MVEENVFDSMAEKYDAWYDSEDGRPLYESELRCLRPLVPKSGGPVLEIGVGTGRFAMHFPGAYGVDPAFGALKIAQTRGIKCAQGRGESLPFRDKTFGAILIIVTLCFVEDPVLLLQEARRVLNDDGCIVIGFIPGDSPWGILYEEKKGGGNLFYRNARFYTIDDVEGLVKGTSLKVTKIRSTLLQDLAGPAKAEEPLEGHVKRAGFICLTVERKK